MSKKKKLPLPVLPVEVIDSHAHVLGGFYRDESPEAIMERAREVNVVGCINIGTDLITTAQARETARTIPGIGFTAGFHPHDASKLDDQTLGELEEHALAGALAIGEIGLDFHYDYSPRPAQEKAFEAQLDLAARLSLPVVVHSREADQRTMDILAPWFDKCSILLHCFAGDLEQARMYTDLGAWISLSGVVTYPSNTKGREVLRGLPHERLMFETDCPFLPPEPRRGRVNEPAFLAFTLDFAAQFTGRSLEQVCQGHMRAVTEFFRIGKDYFTK